MNKQLPSLFLLSLLAAPHAVFGQVAHQVKDINTTLSAAGSNPIGGVTIGNISYFTATESANGYELWRSDGTEAGTWLVKDIVNGSSGLGGAYFLNLNGTLIVFGNGMY